MSYDLSLGVIMAARRRIAAYVRRTPLLPLPAVSPDLADVRLKLENLQVSGSFKARGVFNTLLQLHGAERTLGVVTASGGNHGVALAYGASRLGIPATVFLPATAGDDRAARIERWGADVIRHGVAWDDAHEAALAHAQEIGQSYIHPFDAEQTVAGQGTLGLELLDDISDLDRVLVAIGGGGLIAGVAAAIKQIKPNVHVVGVEPIGASSMLHSLEGGRVVSLPTVRTIADTLAPRSVSERTLALTQRYVDEIVQVDDMAMVEAMRELWVECNQLVEPAGAAVLAAIRTGAIARRSHHQTAAIICGGNAAAEPVFSTYAEAAALIAGRT